MVFHVLNRANARMQVFDDDGDYEAFQRVMVETVARVPMRVLAYCIMPNHWHLVLWPREDGDLGAFMQRLTTTHVRRWHLHRHSVGSGHLYQGTYKSFPVQSDTHFLSLCCYVERNALRAGLVEHAEHWSWGSLGAQSARREAEDRPPLSAWPVVRPRNWVALVNRPQNQGEEDALRLSVRRGRPYGDPSWQQRVAKRLRLESTFRPRGRPRKRS